jgi:PAS domain-containing protein
MRDAEGRLIGVLGIARDITALRRAERELQQHVEALSKRERIYSAIVNQAADSIGLIDIETGRFVEFNTAAHCNLGYGREEFARLTVMDLEAAE